MGSIRVALLIMISASREGLTQDESQFSVIHFSSGFAEGPIVLLERPVNLHYEAPYLTMNATVRCTTPGDDWVVGFVQQVNSTTIRNDYPRAFTSWEHPKTPTCDTGIGETPPWYRRNSGTSAVRADSKEFDAVVAHDDNLTGNVTWNEPLLPHGDKLGEAPTLQRVARAQSFTTWLIARRGRDGKIRALKKATWKIEFELEINCRKPVGERCKVVRLITPPPVISDPGEDRPLEQAMNGPSANESQEFWWNPKSHRIGKRTRLSP